MSEENKEPMSNENDFWLEPFGHHIVIEEMEEIELETTESGIYVGTMVDELKDYRYGRVVAVGPGAYDHGKWRATMLTGREGVVVIFRRHSGWRIPRGRKEYIVLSEGEVIGVLKKEYENLVVIDHNKKDDKK